jgi:hypothetical protein
MKRVIVDYSKLTSEILNLLVDKFPDGYDDSDIIRFKNAKDETIEAVEVRTEDTIFLVKISMKLSDRIINYDDDDVLAIPTIKEPLEDLKELGLESETDEEEEDETEKDHDYDPEDDDADDMDRLNDDDEEEDED